MRHALHRCATATAPLLRTCYNYTGPMLAYLCSEACWTWQARVKPYSVTSAVWTLSLLLSEDSWMTRHFFSSQLGHPRTDDKTVALPKLVTSLADKRIRFVSTTNASIVVATENGDVIAIQDFASKRILSTKPFEVVKMVASGGHLDPKVVPNSNLVCTIY